MIDNPLENENLTLLEMVEKERDLLIDEVAVIELEVSTLRAQVATLTQQHGVPIPTGGPLMSEPATIAEARGILIGILDHLDAEEEENDVLRARVEILEAALVAARQWIEPVVDGFGLDPETHGVLQQINTALASPAPGEGEKA